MSRKQQDLLLNPKLGKPLMKRFADFSGGLNNKFSPFLLKDNELADICNFTLDEKGTLQKRRGYRRLFSADVGTAPVRSMFNFRRDDGSSKLVFASGDKLYYTDPAFRKLYDSQAEWDAGTKNRIDTATSPGDLQIAAYAATVTETAFTSGTLEGLVNV